MSYIYRRTSHANLQPSKTVTPTTSAQTVTPDAGYDGLQEVEVDAVTSAIDANIQPGNIKQGVEILGVVGTLTQGIQIDGATVTGDLDIASFFQTDSARRARITSIDDSSTLTVNVNDAFVGLGAEYIRLRNATSLAYAFGANDKCKTLILDNVTTAQGHQCRYMTALEVFVAPSLTIMPTYMFRANQVMVSAEFGTLTAWGSVIWDVCRNMRSFTVGVGTAINIQLNKWTATNVIAEGPAAIAELNANIVSGLANRVADRTGDSALTITFGTALYNVLTAETLAAFTSKNWNVAYA